MQELELLHSKVAMLIEKYNQCKTQLLNTQKELEQKNQELAEAQLQINIMKPVMEEAQGISTEKQLLQVKIDQALSEVNKILDLIQDEPETKA